MSLTKRDGQWYWRNWLGLMQSPYFNNYDISDNNVGATSVHLSPSCSGYHHHRNGDSKGSGIYIMKVFFFFVSGFLFNISIVRSAANVLDENETPVKALIKNRGDKMIDESEMLITPVKLEFLLNENKTNLFVHISYFIMT